MLALAAIERDTNSLGIPLSEATDPANQFRYVTRRPTTDWSLHTLEADKKAFYAAHDTDKDHPMNRAGHLWSVHLGDPPPTE